MVLSNAPRKIHRAKFNPRSSWEELRSLRSVEGFRPAQEKDGQLAKILRRRDSSKEGSPGVPTSPTPIIHANHPGTFWLETRRPVGEFEKPDNKLTADQARKRSPEWSIGVAANSMSPHRKTWQA